MKTNVVFSEPKYIINEDKGVVVCIMEVDPNIIDYNAPFCAEPNWFIKKFNTNFKGEFTVKGVAKCAFEDTFDAELGKRIAESKAKKQGFAIASQIMEIVFDKVCTAINQLGVYAFNCKQAYYHEEEHINYLVEDK